MKFIFSSLLILFFLTNTFSQTKISKDIWKALDKQEKIDCIIEMNNQWQAPEYIKEWTKDQKGRFVFSALKAFAQKDQSAIQAYLNEQNIPFQSFFIFNGLKLKINKSQLNLLIQNFDIKSVAYDQPVPLNEIDRTNIGTREEIEWGILQIEADKVWEQGYKGSGVVVGGQDTGYDFDNPFIFENYRGYGAEVVHDYNWHDAIRELSPLHNDPDTLESNNPCGLDSKIPCDDHGHGSHTMGTMTGDDDEIKIGVAPEAQWIGCRNMERGWGKPSTYTECFQWFLAPTDLNDENPKPELAPHVINNSWGCPPVEGCNEDNWSFMESAVNNLVSAGVVVVVSAGNDGSAGCGSIVNPASIFENSFTVGATNIMDTIGGFSSIGNPLYDDLEDIKPDVVAPGVDVKSITLNGFGTWNGTSMAGPHVAAAVALVINANPSLAGKVDKIESILKESAKHISNDVECTTEIDDVPNIVYGHGRINVAKAVELALLYSGTETISDSDYKIHPNPTSNQLFLVSDGFKKIGLNYTIIDATGRVINSRNIDNIVEKVDVSDFSNGIYAIIITQNNKHVETLKFVKL